MPLKMKLVRVVTNQSRLAASRPGDPQFGDRVRAALHEWEVALRGQAIRAELVPTDDLVGGSRRVEAKRIRQHLVQLQEEQKADYTLILGGDNVVPFYRLLDPVQDMTNDRFVYSDDPYVSYDDTYLYKPKHPVGRFPHGQGQRDDLLVELFQRSVYCHRQGWDSIQRVALTTQSWRSKSRLTWPKMASWYECPPWRLSSAPHDPAPACTIGPDLLAAKTLHYYNLHGQKNDEWLGECDCEWITNAYQNDPYPLPCQPPALSVAQIPDLPPAVVFSSACYGSFITRPKPPTNLALGFLRQGALAFIGATARAYTEIYPLESLRYSDLIAHTFLKMVEENQATSSQRRIGEILQAVKNDYQLGYDPRPPDFKTLWEFVLYGDPTLIPFGSIATQEKAI